MKGKIFSYKLFSSRTKIVDFINENESFTPISVLNENGHYVLFYTW